MVERLVLLPGWGLGNAPLEPLVAALHVLDRQLQVEIEPLPEPAGNDLDDWLDVLDSRVSQGCWLGGWSLGGMLAAGLAAQRGAGCAGLLLLASNPCFVARDDWPTAMSEPTFNAFLEGCSADPLTSLKRFALLCAQGAQDPRALGRHLFANAPLAGAGSLLKGLELLHRADVRQALSCFSGPQLHLLAASDGLVPQALAGVLPELQNNIEVVVLESGGHAFALESPMDVAVRLQGFIRGASHD